jgi:hypothetical protein
MPRRLLSFEEMLVLLRAGGAARRTSWSPEAQIFLLDHDEPEPWLVRIEPLKEAVRVAEKTGFYVEVRPPKERANR